MEKTKTSKKKSTGKASGKRAGRNHFPISQCLPSCALALLLLGAAGCEKPPVEHPVAPAEGNFSPAGTRWKLAGILDEGSGTLRVLEPAEYSYPECYTLEFDTDSTATGYSEANLLYVNLACSGDLIHTQTYVYELGEDGRLFMEAISGRETDYSISATELKFFFDENRKSLLYHPRE